MAMAARTNAPQPMTGKTQGGRAFKVGETRIQKRDLTLNPRSPNDADEPVERAVPRDRTSRFWDPLPGIRVGNVTSRIFPRRTERTKSPIKHHQDDRWQRGANEWMSWCATCSRTATNFE